MKFYVQLRSQEQFLNTFYRAIEIHRINRSKRKNYFIYLQVQRQKLNRMII
jgi:hypothetical protein